jgi:hypothetical protein
MGGLCDFKTKMVCMGGHFDAEWFGGIPSRLWKFLGDSLIEATHSRLPKFFSQKSFIERFSRCTDIFEKTSRYFSRTYRSFSK